MSPWSTETPEYKVFLNKISFLAFIKQWGYMTFKDGVPTIVGVSFEECIPLFHKVGRERINEETDLSILYRVIRIQVCGQEQVGNESRKNQRIRRA